MRDLDLIKHIYSVDLDLSRETILTINALSLVFNLDNIFTVNDTKEQVLTKLNELYPNKKF